MEENIEKHSDKQIVFGALLSYLTIGLSVLTGLLFTPWLSSCLGVSDYGLYTLGTSLVGVFALDYGLSAASAKFLSVARSKNDSEEAGRFMSTISCLYLAIDAFLLILVIVLSFFLPNLYTGLSNQEIERFRPIFYVIGAYSFLVLPLISLNSVFTAYEKFVPLKLFSLLSRLLSVGLMSLGLLLHMSLLLIIVFNLAGSLFTDILKIIYLREKCPIRISFRLWDKEAAKSIFALTVWIGLEVLGQDISRNLAPTILGVVSDTQNIALFGYASTIENYVWSISSILSGMFLSKIVRLSSSQDANEKLYHLFLHVGKYQLAFLGLILFGFATVGRFFISRLMGEDYLPSYWCVFFLVFPLLLSMPKIPMNSQSYLVGTVKYSAIIYFFFSAVSCGLTFYFGHLYGALGAAATYGICSFIANLVQDLWVYWKLQKIDIPNFILQCYVRILPLFVFETGICLLFYFFWPITSWWIFFCQSFLIILSYLAFCCLFYFSSDERKNLKDILKKVF